MTADNQDPKAPNRARRLAFWVVVLWNLLMAAWFTHGLMNGGTSTIGVKLGENGMSIGVGVTIILGLWVIGEIVLVFWYASTKPRQ